MKKNPPEMYGVKYLKGLKASRALDEGTEQTTRWDDNGTFFGAAVTAKKLAEKLGCRSVLDVGCGRGFTVRHLRNMGLRADGIEYGTEAVEHSVCEAKWGDLTDTLPPGDETYDLTISLGVLSHPPKETTFNALSELRRVTKKALWTGIQVVPHELQLHHLTIMPPDWWQSMFSAAGWKDAGLTEWLDDHGRNINKLAWSNVWLPR